MKKNIKSAAAILRQKAEDLLNQKPFDPSTHQHLSLSEEDTLKLNHELVVHQFELELQNEELKLAKEQAELATDKYTGLFDFAPSGYLSLSRDGEIMELNLMGAQMLGENRFRLKNSRFGFFVSDDTKAVFNRFLEKVFSGKAKQTCEVSLITEGKQPAYVHLSGIVTGKDEQCLLAMIDLTQPKLEHELLHQSEEKYSRIFDTSPYAIMVTDAADSKIIEVNKAFTRISGYTLEEAVADSTIGLKLWTNLEDRKRVLSALREGKEVTSEEYLFTTKSGKTINGQISAQVIHLGNKPYIFSSIEDITERKLVEEKMRFSEEKYRTIFESVHDAYYEANIEGIILDISPSIEIISKGQYSRDELIGQSLIGFYADPDARNYFYSELQKHGHVTDYEISLLNKDGSIVPIAISSNLSYDASGKPVKLIGTLRDITERKLAEKKMLQSEEKYRHIFENIQDAYYESSLDGTLLEISPSIKILSKGQYTREELIGKSLFDLYANPEDRNAIAAEILKNGIVTDYEVLMRNKDGSIIPAAISSSLLFDPDGKTEKFSGSIRDITHRKLIEQEIKIANQKTKESEEKLRSIIQSQSEGIGVVNEHEVFEFVNLAATKIFETDQLIGVSLFDFLSPDEKERINRQTQARQTGISNNYELQILTPKGNNKYLNISSSPRFDENGNYLGAYGVFRDISEQKRAQDEIKAKTTLLTNLIVNLEEGILLENADREILITNQLFCDMFAIPAPPEALIGADCSGSAEQSKMMFKNPDSFIVGIDKMLADKITILDFELELADGRYFERDYIPTYIENTYSGHLWKYRDISERKEIENRIKFSEEKFRSITEQTNDLIAIADSDGLITYASPAAASLFLISPKAMIGCSFVGFIDESDMAKGIKGFRDCLEKDISIKNAEFRMKRADGTLFTGELNGSLFHTKALSGVLVIIRDITERKADETELKQLSQAVAQSPVSILITNLDGTIEYANPKACEVSGYSIDELIGNNSRVLKSGETNDLEYQALWETIIAGKQWSGLFHNKKKNGELYWESTNISPIVDASGKPTHFLAVKEDITERKSAHDRIHSSEEKYRSIFESVQDAYFEASIDGKILEISPSIEIITKGQYCRDEMIGKPFAGIYANAEDRNVYFTKLFEQKRLTDYELLLRNKDGSLIPAVVSAALSLDADGKPLKISGILRDITERKKAEETLKQSEAALNYSQEIAKMGSWEFNVITGKVSLSNSYYILLGLKPDKTELTMDALYGLVHPDYKLLLEEKLAEIYHQRKPISFDSRLILPDGQIKWVQNSIVPVTDGDTLIALKGVNIDITENKLAEQKIRELNENLELKVVLRTAQLEETNKILEIEIQNRVLVEAEREIEKQRLADIIRGTNVGTWEWNVQTGETIFNERWAEILGYTLAEISPVNIETWIKFTHPDDLKLSDEWMEKHFNGELDYYSLEARNKHKNGDWIWGLTRGKIHTWDAAGKPLLMSGTYQDITERKRADEFEAELLQLSLQLTGIPNAEIPAALNLAIDKIGRFLSADRAYIFEIDLHENTMNNTYEWCNEGISPQIQHLQNLACDHLPIWWEKMLRNENMLIPSVEDLPDTWQTEREHLGQQGIQSLIAIPISVENNLIGFVGLDSVNTKREYTLPEINMLKVWSNMLASLLNHRRQEEIIEQTRKNYETFFNTIDDFLFVLDEQGNIIHTNTTVTNRLGYTAEELLGMSVLMVHPENRRQEAGRIVGEMLAGTADFCPVPLVTKAGNPISVETRVKQGYWNGKAVVFGVTKDVSKIKLSEEKFSKAFQSNSTLMAISTFDDVFIDVNDTFLSTFGYSRDEVIGNSSRGLAIFESHEMRKMIIGNLKQGIQVRDIESKVRTKSGEIKFGIFSADSIYIGKDLCVLTMMVDITERKKAELALKESESRFSLFMDYLPAVVFLKDQDGRTLFVNKYMNDAFGANSWVGKTMMEVFPNELGEKQTADDINSMSLGYTKIEESMFHLDGKLHYYETQKFTIDRLGQEPWLGGVSLDITKRKIADTELRKSQEQLDLVIKGSNDAPWDWDLAEDKLFYSLKWWQQIGYTPEEIPSDSSLWRTLTHPDDVGYVTDVLEKAMESKNDSYECEFRLLHKNGHYVSVLSRGFITRDITGKPIRITGTNMDLTERKKAENDILKAKNEAEKANLAKSEFLSRMSHELRTPMNSILGFAQLMEMGELNPKQMKGVRHILGSGKHLLKLIDEVLDISRIEAGKLILSHEPVQVGSIIMEMLDSLQPLIVSRHIKMELNISSNYEQYIMADRQRLKQVLLNLLTNAVKYNKEGGTISISISVIPQSDGGETSVRISISDTGNGISEEDMPKIFTPFERIGAEKTDTEGTGLGLAVVKKFMDAMDGNTGVESKPGEGSTFWIELPMAGNTKSRKTLNEENLKLTADLGVAKTEIGFQKVEKTKRADELKDANIELAFQNEEKGKRADELKVANIELDFQNEEKGKRADELKVANIELEFQNEEKEERADELKAANIELAFQNEEKGKRADELKDARKEIDFLTGQNREQAVELDHANKELSFLKMPSSIPPTVQSAKSGTILYIEDNQSNIELIEQILANHRPDIRLLSNYTGKETVRMAIECAADLILLDLDLPDLHGGEVLEQLKTDEITKNIPVVIISADAMPHQLEKLMQAGAKDYITKPLDIIAFLNMVDEWLK